MENGMYWTQIQTSIQPQTPSHFLRKIDKNKKCVHVPDMDFFRQVQLILFSTIIIREAFGKFNVRTIYYNFNKYVLNTSTSYFCLQENASNDATTGQNSSEITALLDFEAGMVYYKDEEQGICFVEFLESVLEDSFVIRVPESGNLSHGIEETSPLAKEFCGSYQVYWIGEFLSQNTRERRKRSPQNGFAPRGKLRHKLICVE